MRTLLASAILPLLLVAAATRGQESEPSRRLDTVLRASPIVPVHTTAPDPGGRGAGTHQAIQ